MDLQKEFAADLRKLSTMRMTFDLDLKLFEAQSRRASQLASDAANREIA